MITIILILTTLFTSPSQPQGRNKELLAREAIEKFIRLEFNFRDEELWHRMVKLSPRRQQLERQRNPDLSGIGWFSWDDSFFVAESYHIGKINVGGNKANGVVTYKRVGKSNGNETVISDSLMRDTVIYSLVYHKKQWLIVDPPLPRISLDTLINFYQRNQSSFKTYESLSGKHWLDDTSVTEMQKDYYRRIMKSLDVLKSLKH
jgi:hypothetical protein